MILYPAIDLKDGQCVRCSTATWTKATVFNTSPADQAARFAKTASSGCTSSTSTAPSRASR
jgi:phosphoribosylformimino-5-aminoimidazole carboxamide ribotide isomerase